MKLRELLPKGIYSIKPKKDNDEYYDNIMDYILDNTSIEDLVSIWESVENHPVFKGIPKFYKNKEYWDSHYCKEGIPSDLPKGLKPNKCNSNRTNGTEWMVQYE